MHLTCLGTFKRFLQILTRSFGGIYRPHWLTDEEKEETTQTTCLASYLSKEFHRKVRPLKDLCWWKIVEFRTSFLYTGLITLQNVSVDCLEFRKEYIKIWLLLGFIT